MQKKILIVIGGQAPDMVSVKTKYDILIAADAGVYNCKKAGITPDIIIGDFDSISEEEAANLYQHAEQLIYPIDKDHSDTEIAIMHSIEKFGNVAIDLLGGGGGRFDHVLEIMILLKKYHMIQKWLFKDNSIHRLHSTHSLNLPVGSNVSFFAPAACMIKKSEGLQWELTDRILTPDFMSLSNRVSESTIYISIKYGYCFLVQNPGASGEEYLL